jgi:hypothetical protein
MYFVLRICATFVGLGFLILWYEEYNPPMLVAGGVTLATLYLIWFV